MSKLYVIEIANNKGEVAGKNVIGDTLLNALAKLTLANDDEVISAKLTESEVIS